MNRLPLLAVALPIVVMGGWVGRLSWLERTGVLVHLSVTGFDPRDLLAGHYLTYTVDYGMTVCPQVYEPQGSPTCVCLIENSESKTHEANWAGACEQRPSECSVFIQGDCSYGRFQAEIERFYFPDSFQSELAIVPERSAVTVIVSESGHGLVTGFTVDGVDVLEYARTHSNDP